MKWAVMIVAKHIRSHVAFIGNNGPLASEDDMKMFDTYNEAVDESKNVVHMLEPLEITQVRIISDEFMKYGT